MILFALIIVWAGWLNEMPAKNLRDEMIAEQMGLSRREFRKLIKHYKDGTERK